MLVETLVVAFWALLPAYVPNNAASLFGGGPPIDAGRTLGGRRVLGDGKTWRGLAAGLVAGVTLAIVLSVLAPRVAPAVPVVDALPRFSRGAAFGLAGGAMVGDMAASFVKRRLGRERGQATPGLDQLDFVVGALALATVLDPAWVGEWITLPVLAVALVVTPLLHVGVNAAGYAIGLSKEPY